MNVGNLIKSLVLIPLACLSGALAARGRPHLDTSLGFNVLLSDKNTLLRGVSLSIDGGDPYGSLPPNVPTQAQLDAIATTYGLNTLHLYLEADSAGVGGNNNPIGYNSAICDTIVERCASAGLYLIITIGCNGKNGQMSLTWSRNFWNFYGPRYANRTHVIYEAHNEPASNSLWQWTTNDWNNQIELYRTIRAVAPDTFILLCSFMGFAGDNNINSVYDSRNRSNYLVANGVSWANAGMAHHGYESKAGIATQISLIQTSTDYPALLSTEFWPGDTTGQEYNNMYESYYNGWMQFQWLGANDIDLVGTDGFKQKINIAGTVWTPDDASCTWPAKGTPTSIPANNSTVGVYDRGASRFVRMVSGGDLVADLTGYTGDQSDRFTVEVTTSGMKMISLRAANGMYVSTSSEIDTLTANSATAGTREKFQWIELVTGPVVLRALGGGGHLIQSKTGGIFPSADNGLQSSQHYTFVDGYSPSGPPLLPTTLPSPWTNADIGAVGAVGSAIYGSGVFTVAGSGADIESTADGFQYVYQAANGDVTIVARVATQQNTDWWAKTGIMIRESTAAGSKNVAVLMTPQGGVTFQRRTIAGGSTATNVKSGVTVPQWVKLVRSGNSFSAYHSADGVSWTQIDSSQTVTMAANVILGLAVSSHQLSTLCESTLDNVSLIGVYVAQPVFGPAAGSYTEAQSVTISSATSGASIRYTVDGSTPTSTTGVVYSTPIIINATTTLKAIAYKSGLADSTVATGFYTIVPCSSPVLTVQPQSLNVTEGASATFSVSVVGSAPLAYQWRKGGVSISSATSSTYGIFAATTNDGGSYDVVVTNGCGTATSTAATLTVMLRLPSPWTNADIGAVGAVGRAIYGSGVFTVAGSGADIESTADGFQYVYQAANGDVSIVARIATQQNTDYWAKTGIMIRESTAAGSKNVAVLMTPQGGVTFQRRTSAGGTTAVNVKSGVTVPEWVKLVRSGNSFSAYHSADGVSWTQIDSSQTVTMAANVTLGLAVSSHQLSTLCESTLDNVVVATMTASPTGRPSSNAPTTSRPSTLKPTPKPTTAKPTTRAPTSRKPTNVPTSKPTTAKPTTRAPTSRKPTNVPTS